MFCCILHMNTYGGSINGVPLNHPFEKDFLFWNIHLNMDPPVYGSLHMIIMSCKSYKHLFYYKPCIHHSPTRQQSETPWGHETLAQAAWKAYLCLNGRRSEKTAPIGDRVGWVGWVGLDFYGFLHNKNVDYFFGEDFHGLSYFKKMWLQAVRNLEIPVYDWDWAGFVGINPTRNRITQHWTWECHRATAGFHKEYDKNRLVQHVGFTNQFLGNK